MNLEELKLIENTYNFTYPEIYKALLKDNMLNWGELSSDWLEQEYPKLKDSPPFLLYGTGFEIISTSQEILREIEYFSDKSDYRQTKKELHNKFIPFGKTGSGDLYCFYLDNNNTIEGVVVVWHDDNEVEVLANNLEDFIFRNLLECVIDPYEDSLIMYGDFKNNIKNQISTHKKYLHSEQLAIIEEVYSRETNPLLTDDELSEILEKQNFKIMSFEYQRE